MSTRRVHVSSAALDESVVELSGSAHHYLFRVLRLVVGESVVLFDGAGREADAHIERVTGDAAWLRVGERRQVGTVERPRFVALVSLIKGERMEWCIQKLVELGVDEIIPLAAARSVVKLPPARAETRRKRYQSIATDAARQCERATVPVIGSIVDLDEAVESLDPAAVRLVFVARGGQPVSDALPGPCESVAFAIGPEGGYEPEELERLEQARFVGLSLGPRVLRAETAAIAALAVLGFVLGDLG